MITCKAHTTKVLEKAYQFLLHPFSNYILTSLPDDQA